MKNSADSDAVAQSCPGPVFSILADPEYESRSDEVCDPRQSAIADLEEGDSLLQRQLVGRAVAAGGFEECQRTVIPHKEPLEEGVGVSEARLRPTPQALAADFAALTLEPFDWAFRMRLSGPADTTVDTEPVAHQRHLAEGYPCLRHPPRSRIHPDEQHFRRRSAVELEIPAVGLEGVDQGIVDVGDGNLEPKTARLAAEAAGD